MLDKLGIIFSTMMSWCYIIVKNYGVAIIVFTLLTKIIMLPISILVQVNSIKMVKMYPEMNRIKAKYFGSNDLISEENYKLYKKENYHPMLDLVPVIVQLLLLMGVVEGLKKFQVENTVFLGIDLGLVPSKALGITILIPLIAGLSAWYMCHMQNRINVLQAEQSKANKISTLSVSVALSLYLGFFVQGGVGLYWIAGNLLSVVQLVLLNMAIDPKKHVDYENLEASKQELEAVKAKNEFAKKKATKEEIEKEKVDYKRFMKAGSKQIVFYSEKNGFYKYFKDIIELIIKKTDIVVHYVTSDINDAVFKLESEQFKVYYVGESKLIVLMMKMDADIVVMTTPDLEKYHIKRSLIRKDIEYIYIDHGINSGNMVLRKHALDYFDTIFAANDKVVAEIEAQEKTYNLKKKNIVKWGYALIDNMIEDYEKNGIKNEGAPKILIGPSWQDDNIMDLCIEELLDGLKGHGYEVVVRPHPQYIRHFSERINELQSKYSNDKDIRFETDFSSNSTVFNADILITDWSGIAYEYAFTTLKPVLFVNTPMKVLNPDYEEIGVVPFDIEIRNQIGIAIEVDDANKVDASVEKLLNNKEYSSESLRMVRENSLYNIGSSANVGANYIIKRLIEISRR